MERVFFEECEEGRVSGGSSQFYRSHDIWVVSTKTGVAQKKETGYRESAKNAEYVVTVLDSIVHISPFIHLGIVKA